MTATNPLAAVATPPHGIVGSIDNAARRAADGDIRVARAVVEAVEPLIVQDCIDRILRRAQVVTEWGYRLTYPPGCIHYKDGSTNTGRVVRERWVGSGDRDEEIARSVVLSPRNWNPPGPDGEVISRMHLTLPAQTVEQVAR